MPRTEKQFEEMREKSKTAIVNAALKLFAKKGFSGTSISDISKEAGVSKGLAYNYFESKEELAKAVFMTLNDLMLELFQLLEKVDSPKEKLIKLFELTFENLKSNQEYWLLYMNFVMQPEASALSKKHIGEFIASIIPFFIDLFKQMGSKTPEAEGRIYAAIIDGVCFHYFFEPETYPISEIKNYITDVLLARY